MVVIDMQTDFCSVGDYVDTMGYDLSLTRAPITHIRTLLATVRPLGFHIIHTREGHRPDLSDAPPAKLARGAPSVRIGDVGPMGRILIRGEPGHAIIEQLCPLAAEPGIETLLRRRRHHRGVRAYDGARSQRSRLSSLAARGCDPYVPPSRKAPTRPILPTAEHRRSVSLL
jgi:nicotinamidase-related amidase